VSERLAVPIAIVAVVGMICFLFFAIHRRNEFDEKCHLVGGVPFHSRESNAICIKPGSVIEMPK
jgi:hypothetical protein